MTTIAEHVDPFLAYLADVRRMAPNTVRAYRSDMTVLAARLTGDIAACTHRDLEVALAADRHAAPATRQRRQAALCSFFRWALRDGLVATPIADMLDAPTVDRALPRPIPAADRGTVERIIAASPHPHTLVLTILRETGMRVSEVVGLNIGDITLTAGNEGLLVRNAKNNVDRVVVLGPDATPKTLRVLRAHLRALGAAALPHQPLVTSDRATRLTYAAVEKHWRQACIRAGLADDGAAKYTLHQLRHTLATELIREVREDVVGRQLGHKDPRSTRRYAELQEADVRAALGRRRR